MYKSVASSCFARLTLFSSLWSCEHVLVFKASFIPLVLCHFSLSLIYVSVFLDWSSDVLFTTASTCFRSKTNLFFYQLLTFARNDDRVVLLTKLLSKQSKKNYCNRALHCTLTIRQTTDSDGTTQASRSQSQKMMLIVFIIPSIN